MVLPSGRHVRRSAGTGRRRFPEISSVPRSKLLKTLAPLFSATAFINGTAIASGDSHAAWHSRKRTASARFADAFPVFSVGWFGSTASGGETQGGDPLTAHARQGADHD